MELRASDIPSVDPTGAGFVLSVIAQGAKLMEQLAAAKRRIEQSCEAEEETLP